MISTRWKAEIGVCRTSARGKIVKFGVMKFERINGGFLRVSIDFNPVSLNLCQFKLMFKTVASS